MARLNYVKSFRGTSKTEDGTLKCSKCGGTIAKGDSYKWWANRAPGMRGGFRRVRCSRRECHPKPSEMEGNPKRAAIMSMQEGLAADLEAWEASGATDTEELTSIAEAAAENAMEVVEELREGAQNIEDGFGHETYQSEELNERADELEGQIEALADIDLPEPPEESEAEEQARDEADERGEDESEEEYEQAIAAEAERLHSDELDAWREECVQAVTDAADEIYV